MSTKANNSKSEAVRVVMTPLRFCSIKRIQYVEHVILSRVQYRSIGTEYYSNGNYHDRHEEFSMELLTQLLVLLSTELKHDLVNSVRSL